jgi:hypothetical protein
LAGERVVIPAAVMVGAAAVIKVGALPAPRPVRVGDEPTGAALGGSGEARGMAEEGREAGKPTNISDGDCNYIEKMEVQRE